MMLNIHKDWQSPCLCASLRWSYKTQRCIQRISDSPGSQAFRITTFEVESAPHRFATHLREVDRQTRWGRPDQGLWTPWKCQDLPKRREKPCHAAQRPSNSNPALTSSIAEARTLGLQEPDAQSKTKVLDCRAQENGQSHRKQVHCLPEAVQKVSWSVNGPTAKFASGSQISPIFKHRYWYVPAVADQIK